MNDQDDTINRRLVLGILEHMGAQIDANPKPLTAETFGIQKGIRMALGTAMDRIRQMPSAAETAAQPTDWWHDCKRLGRSTPVPLGRSCGECGAEAEGVKEGGRG